MNQASCLNVNFRVSVNFIWSFRIRKALAFFSSPSKKKAGGKGKQWQESLNLVHNPSACVMKKAGIANGLLASSFVVSCCCCAAGSNEHTHVCSHLLIDMGSCMSVCEFMWVGMVWVNSNCMVIIMRCPFTRKIVLWNALALPLHSTFRRFQSYRLGHRYKGLVKIVLKHWVLDSK